MLTYLMSRDLSKMFSPRSVAVIGASADPKKVGAIVLKNIIVSGFKGTIYPINPKIPNIGSLKFYPNITALPETPDMAVIAIPAAAVNEVMEEIGRKGIKNVVVLSAGYKEAGEVGATLEKELTEIANKYEINMLGPNCLGLVNNSCPINATFGEVIKNQGNLRIISQSGALATAMFDWGETNGMGFDQLITIGNKAVTTENEILEYCLQSEETFPVGLYLESIADGNKFRSLVSKISLKNPVFILKPGKSTAAAQAMHSHTGSIAGEDYVLEEALKETGAIRCQELGDFFDMARALSWTRVPKSAKVAVVSNAGGPGVLSTDTISRVGLELAEFNEETSEKLKACLPTAASIHNPIDVMGDALADRFGGALEAVLSDKNVGSVVVILTPQLMTQIEETARIIGNLGKKYEQPILCSFIGGKLTASGNRILNDLRIPTFDFPERAIETLAAMWQWKKTKPTLPSLEKGGHLEIDEQKVGEIIRAAKEKGQATLDNIQANDLMRAIGVPVVPTKNVANIDEAKEFAKKNGWPVVLKLSAPGLLHKSDIGGVVTQIKDENKLTESFQSLVDKKMGQIQVQKEIEGGVEVIIGVRRDSVFGPVLLFGAGGKMTELWADRNLHLLPMTEIDAQNLVTGSRIYKLLSGFRGEKAYDLKATDDIILRLAKLIELTPEIAEVEINPVKITMNGTWALDAKVILA
jgi:acetate---CoA ligase (ADP-forming)